MRNHLATIGLVFALSQSGQELNLRANVPELCIRWQSI